MLHLFCSVQDITYVFETRVPKAQLSVYTAPHTEPEGQVSLVPVHESDEEIHCVQESEYPDATKAESTQRNWRRDVIMRGCCISGLESGRTDRVHCQPHD